MRRAVAVALCASLGASIPGAAAARTVYEEAWAWCDGKNGFPNAHRVEGCAWLIRYGDGKGKDLASAFVNLGQARHDPREPALALASYEQAIRFDPTGALRNLSQVIRLDPRAGEAYNSRGLIRAEQGDLLGAIADYTAALR